MKQPLLDNFNQLFEEKKYEEVYCLFNQEKENIRNDYYQILKIVLNSLEEKQDYLIALNLAKEELALPYIPIEYEDFLHNFYYRISKLAQYDNKQKLKSKNYSDEEIANILNSQDFEKILNIIDVLQNSNIRKFIGNIENLLKSPTMNNSIKAILIELMKLQEINQEFTLINEENLQISFNPYYLEYIIDLNYSDKIAKLIQEKVKIDDISLNSCKKLANIYIYSIYPIIIEEDEFVLLAATFYFLTLKANNEIIETEKISQIFEINENILKASIANFDNTLKKHY